MIYEFNNKGFESTNNEFRRMGIRNGLLLGQILLWLIDYYILGQSSVL